MGIMDKIRSSSSNRMNAINQVSNKGDFKNEFYYPARNKDGIANVVIRFLPQKDLNKVPFAIKYSHFFKGVDGRWCIMDVCPTTFGKNCPVCSKNSELWQTGIEENKLQASAKKRKKEYICNVLIVKDPENPEKEGTVQVFKFGPMIYKMLLDVITPKFEDETPLDPFDLLDGADFNLRIIKDETKNQITYERSKFLSRSPIFNGDEEKITNLVENQLQDLEKYVNEDMLLNEDALESFMNRAYGNSSTKSNSVNSTTQHISVEPEVKQEIKSPTFPESSSKNMDNDDMLNEFRNLIKD